MNDATVRGNCLYTSRLSAPPLSNPRTWNRVSQSKVNRAYRTAAYRETLIAALSCAEHRGSQLSQQQAAHEQASGSQLPNLGYPRQLHARYHVGEELGSGGYATVYVVTDKNSSRTLACKSVSKSVEAGASSTKAAEHIEAIKREILVLKRLRGSLNVASLEEVYEDDTHVHMLMEHCKGGELVHRIGDRHYSERTVASYMRAVLRTLYQCHSNHILHRDVKPGNFMLVNDHDKAPLKAIDFGLAATFSSANEPRSDLGLEGTAWYMAPECLSSEVLPASDVWSAGVMAFQLLTGQFPFDDKQNPFRPSVAKIWHSILTSRLDFNKRCWDGISDGAKDFVQSLLVRDPTKRPTAKQALWHPWLRGDVAERSLGRPLQLSAVQRIQRFAAGSLFKRTIYQHIAEDMLVADPTIKSAVSCPIDSQARPLVISTTDSPLQSLLQSLDFDGDNNIVDRQKVSDGLQRLGYKLNHEEMQQLLDQVDTAHTGQLAKSQIAASQIDWQAVQQRNADQWLASVRKVFQTFDTDADGIIAPDQIVECLRTKLPPSEVSAAVEQAMQEAQKREQSMHEGLTFDNFLRMLRSNSSDSLDQFDDRMSGGGSWHGSSSSREGSVRCGDMYMETSHLDTISEVC